MGELRGHWTQRGVDDFLYRIASDFVQQIERLLEGRRFSQAKLAEKLGVTEGRISQVLNNPGNLTLKQIIRYARALGQKVSIVAYDDNDPNNENGPINAEIFARCWERAGKPADFLALPDMKTASAGDAVIEERAGYFRYHTKQAVTEGFRTYFLDEVQESAESLVDSREARTS